MGALLESLSSYDTNIMLVAIIFLLLVTLFVVLLHVYAKWFLSRTHHLRRAPPPPPPPVLTHLVMVPSSRPYTNPATTSLLSKGVETSAIASIPVFVYTKQLEEGQTRREEEECVICLSVFEEGEAGRRLVGCGHAFHVACIDTWLRSNSTCPVCRAPPLVIGKKHGSVGAAEGEEETAVAVLETAVVVSMQPQPQPASSTSSSSPNIFSVPNNNNNNSSGSSSSSSSSSSSLGSSLKRILSRNRSEGSKVFPSIVSVISAVGDQLDIV